MTLICRPVGRGNWKTVTITINRAPDLFAVKINERLRFGPWLFRVVRVLP